MIVCPECGADSVVLETRSYAIGARRRRKCIGENSTCNHKFTTYEIVIDTDGRVELGRGEALGVVRISDLERIRELLGKVTPLILPADDEPETKD